MLREVLMYVDRTRIGEIGSTSSRASMEKLYALIRLGCEGLPRFTSRSCSAFFWGRKVPRPQTHAAFANEQVEPQTQNSEHRTTEEVNRNILSFFSRLLECPKVAVGYRFANRLKVAKRVGFGCKPVTTVPPPE